MTKENCWEFMKCGCEPGGARSAEQGICPAATKASLNGAHGGKNGGRVCWAVAGTLCAEQVRGRFAGKIETCRKCSFYLLVRNQERAAFIIESAIHKHCK